MTEFTNFLKRQFNNINLLNIEFSRNKNYLVLHLSGLDEQIDKNEVYRFLDNKFSKYKLKYKIIYERIEPFSKEDIDLERIEDIDIEAEDDLLESYYSQYIENNFEKIELAPKKKEDIRDFKIGKFPEKFEISDIESIYDKDELTYINGKIYGIRDGEISVIQTKTGSKIYSFDIEDRTGAVSCKYFCDKRNIEIGDKLINKKNYLTLMGRYVFDDYDGKNIFRITGLKSGIEEKKLDKAEKKRIEFNMHTQMTGMEGLISIDSLATRLKDYGHAAVGISDKNCVYAFPTAYNALKASNIKLNMGLDAKILDDKLKILSNPYNRKLNSKIYTVFDIETTGLSKFNDRITEIGAVRIENGRIVDIYEELVNPEIPIPDLIVELTGISNEMVSQADTIEKVLPRFINFAKDSIFVAHNAEFDLGFIRQNMKMLNLSFEPIYIDTLTLARALKPDLKNHKLGTLSKAFKVSLENHHRASDDAYATAEIFIRLLDELNKRNIKVDEGLNKLETTYPVSKNPSMYNLILVRNLEGLKNLYKLVSKASMEYFFRSPGIPKSLLEEYRKGLLLGSGGVRGDLFSALAQDLPEDIIRDIAQKYDFFQVEPPDFTEEIIKKHHLVKDEDHFKNIVRKIVNLGKEMNKPVIATGDVYYLDKEDFEAKNVLINYNRKIYFEEEGIHRFRNTEEMMGAFDFLGDDAYDVVVENTHILSNMLEDISPIPIGTFTPHVENAEENLRKINYDNAKKIYGEKLPEIVKKRLDRELNSIISNGYAALYIVARELVIKSNKDGYVVGSRGSVGSSFVATMSDITEVNPLVAHYVCPNCKNSEFITDGSYSSGIDMPDKNCPVCGHKYNKDGHDIPFEVFLGFNGDKEPDIDLNFAGEYQGIIHKYTEVIFGQGKVFRAGTIGEVQEKTALAFMRKFIETYPEKTKKYFNMAEQRRMARKLTGTRRTTGQHAGGVMIIPKDKEVFDFTPIQFPADDQNSGVITTHFNYKTLSGRILKLDLLGHNVPTIIRALEDLTGIDPSKINLSDKETMSIFSSTKALKPLYQYSNIERGTLGIPEFGTSFTMGMLRDTNPTTFSELVRISGLSHGTDVWLGNAQTLIQNKVTDLSHAICTRDDIMINLIQYGIENLTAFKTMERVRKGRKIDEEVVPILREHGVPDWYIDSCNKIKYMFPKAHAVAYVLMSYRIAYYKVHHPESFYATFFDVKLSDFQTSFLFKDFNEVSSMLEREKVKKSQRDPSAISNEKLSLLEVIEEMYARGYKFGSLDLYKSSDLKFGIDTEKKLVLPPLAVLDDVSEAIAVNICENRDQGFISRQDFRDKCSKVTNKAMEALITANVLNNLPESNQISFFSL